MSIIGGPVSSLLVAVTVVAAFGFWLVRRPRHPGPRLVGSDGIDREELDAAEREVRELPGTQRPDEDFQGDDWGPGAAKPRPPVRL